MARLLFTTHSAFGTLINRNSKLDPEQFLKEFNIDNGVYVMQDAVEHIRSKRVAGRRAFRTVLEHNGWDVITPSPSFLPESAGICTSIEQLHLTSVMITMIDEALDAKDEEGSEEPVEVFLVERFISVLGLLSALQNHFSDENVKITLITNPLKLSENFAALGMCDEIINIFDHQDVIKDINYKSNYRNNAA